MKIVFALLLLSTCECYKILCLLPYPGKSHYLVFEPLLEELLGRGHELTVVSFFPPVTPRQNRTDVSLVGLAPLNVEVVDLSKLDGSFFGLESFFIHMPLITELAKSNLNLCEKLLGSDAFKQFIEGRGNYDLILVEHFNSDCMLGLIYNYGVPFVGLSSCAFLPWTPARLGAPDNPAYVPLMTLPFTDNMTFMQRIENAITFYIYKWWFEITIRWEEQRILENTLGRKLPPLDEIAQNTSVFLMNTYHTLNGVRVMPPSFVENLRKWVDDAQDGFVLFSFGSLIRGSSLPPKRLKSILKVFEGFPQRFIWKWETEHVENLPENVLVSKWLPQYDLLHHPKCMAFVSHAGLLSLTEATSAGVPTVAIAVLGDQFGNAAHAHQAYGAPYFTLADLNEDRLREALTKVLEPNMRANAKLHSERWKDRPLPPMETAVFYVEQTARLKGLQMSSHARMMIATQLNFLDVIAVVVLIIVLIIIFFMCTYRNCRNINKEKVS